MPEKKLDVKRPKEVVDASAAGPVEADCGAPETGRRRAAVAAEDEGGGACCCCWARVGVVADWAVGSHELLAGDFSSRACGTGPDGARMGAVPLADDWDEEPAAAAAPGAVVPPESSFHSTSF